MTSLVLAENSMLDATARTVTAALALGGPVHVLVAGQACTDAAAAASRLDGVAAVLMADAPLYAHALAEPLAALLQTLAANYDAILAPATSNGKAILPRLAAMLDWPMVSEITNVVTPDTFERPIYAGSVIQTVKATGKLVLTVRPAAFSAAAEGPTVPITKITAGGDPDVSSFAGETVSQTSGPDLSTAKIILTGGRGLQTAGNFALLTRIAARLNAAVGATRAAVDGGFLSNDRQIGQTGKVVAPELYIAAGVSGALQHLSGIKDSKTIVAINKDEEAPIFAIADIALVADLFEALPEIDAELSRRGYN